MNREDLGMSYAAEISRWEYLTTRATSDEAWSVVIDYVMSARAAGDARARGKVIPRKGAYWVMVARYDDESEEA